MIIVILITTYLILLNVRYSLTGWSIMSLNSLISMRVKN